MADIPATNVRPGVMSTTADDVPGPSGRDPNHQQRPGPSGDQPATPGPSDGQPGPAGTGGDGQGATASPDKYTREEVKECFKGNGVYLIQNLNPGPIIDYLQSRSLINTDISDGLEAKTASPREQVNSLCDVVRGSSSLYEAFLEALRDTNQHAVADRLSPNEPSATVSRGPAGLLSDIKDKYHLLIDNIMFHGNFLTLLESRKVITVTQVDELMTISARRDRARKLLRLIEKGETPMRTRGLISALHETEQLHLARLVEEGDESDIIPNDLKESIHKPKVFDRIRKAIESHSLAMVLSRLVEDKLITSAQSESIEAIGDRAEQRRQLIDITMCRPLSPIRQSLSTDNGMAQIIFSARAIEMAGLAVGASGSLNSQSGITVNKKKRKSVEYLRGSKATPRKHTRTALNSLRAASGRTRKGSNGAEEAASTVERYLDNLRPCVSSEVKEKNQELNSRFGIDGDDIFYIDLAMESQVSKVFGKDPEKVEDYIRRTAQSFDHKKTIQITEIFDSTRETRNPCRLLMIGGAGMGKTTVSQEQIRCWADGETEATGILAAYRFECRRLTSRIEKEEKHSLADLILKCHVPGNLSEQTKDAILQYITDNPSSVQITIDGLDELAMWDTCPDKAPDIYNITEPGEIQHIIYNLIRKRLLPKAKVLVTSRPISSLEKRSFDRCIVALGFSQKSIHLCLKALCKTDEIYQKVIDHIEKHKLMVYCFVPLTCVLLGASLRDEYSGIFQIMVIFEIDSMTRLFIKVMLEYIWRRAEIKPKTVYDMSENQRSTLLQLAALAANGMFGMATVIIFDNSHLEAVNMNPDQNNFGLLEITPQIQVGSEYIKPCTANFHHLTFQEFLAALHACVTWDTDAIKKLRGPWSPRLDMVRLYTAGLLGDPEGQKFLEAVTQKKSKKSAENLLLGMAKDNPSIERLTLLSTLTKEAKLETASFRHKLEKKLCSETRGIYTLKASGSVSPHHMADLGSWLETTTLVTGLDLTNTEIGDVEVQAFASSLRKLPRLRELHLGENKIGDLGAQELSSCLKELPRLSKLSLDWNKINKEGAGHLSDLLKESPRLSKLVLRGNTGLDRDTKASLKQEFGERVNF